MARNKIKATEKNTASASHIMRQPTEVSNQTVLEKLLTKNNLLKAEIKMLQELMERNKASHKTQLYPIGLSYWIMRQRWNHLRYPRKPKKWNAKNRTS